MSMVEWRKIGDICEIIRGNGVQKTDFVEDGVGCIHYGQIYTHYGPFTYSTNKFVSKETFEKARKASKGDIVMTDTSENVEDICKSVAYLGEDDIAVSNHALILKHNQNPKFLSYSTLTNSFLDQKRKFVVGVKVSGIKPEQLAKIKIYLPSLSEQNRIVGILDTFTSSIENLKEQIAQRRKQYEYYRGQLLDLEGKEEKDVHSWGEFCEMIKGNGVQKADFVEEGVGCIHYGQIYTHYGSFTYTTNKFVSKETFEKARKASKGDIVMTDTSENVEDICKSVAYLGEDDIAVSNHALILKHKQNSKFLSYSTQTNSFFVQKRKVVVGVKVSGIKPEQLAKIRIFLPSITEQNRIVDILDKFEASIQNLEAQLAEREKQYEYYRNKLLTFE